MTDKPVVIYHSPCPDGFTAAWAIWLIHPEAEFVQGVYGHPPIDVTDRDVIMVDFSYKRDVTMKLIQAARSTLILDHHKTAEAELAGLDVATFDMNKSGARLAWDHFHPGIEAPTLVKYVEDRDLWRFSLKDSEDINSYIMSWPYDFEVWNKTATELAEGSLDSRIGLIHVALKGAAINRKQTRDIEEIIGVCKHRAVIGGHEVWCANLPYTMASQGCNLMAEGEPFAASYYCRGDGKYVYSLRSHEGGADVSEIAKSYGGGGHKHAAGFEMHTRYDVEKN